MVAPGLLPQRVALALALLLAVIVGPALAANGDYIGRQVQATEAWALGLPDHQGQLRRIEDFRGRVMLVFFGFTHCPDVCPTELARLSEVMRLLGSESQRVQVLFVTLDPSRDSPELLRRYVAAFSPSFVALRGSESETARVAKAFRVFYRRLEGSAPGRYTLEHAAYVHAIDPLGRPRLRLTGTMSPEEIAADVRRLLAEN